MEAQSIMEKLRNFKEIISDLLLQIIETLILLFFLFAPSMVNAKSYLTHWLEAENVSLSELLTYIIAKRGNWFIGFFACLIVWRLIIGHNKKYIMNSKNIYHNYPYAIYWFCAKILQIPSCNLILVPIHMQFKLVIRGTFKNYPLDDNLFPQETDSTGIKSEKNKWKPQPPEVNLILEDTYPISDDKLPLDKRSLPQIKITRHPDNDFSRLYSPVFINTINNKVREFNSGTIFNVFATTNPKNNYYIASEVFKNADRSIVKKLLVYQQSRIGGRRFEDAYKIY